MDRRIRFHFVGQNVRPAYLKKTERQLQDLTKPDMEGELHFMIRIVESGPEIKGRFFRLKKLIKRILRPYSAHTASVHRMLIQRIAEQHESLTRLAASVDEMNERVWEDLGQLAETIRAEMAIGFSSVRAGDPVSEISSEDGPVSPGSRLILGSVAVKKPGYVHIDPT